MIPAFDTDMTGKITDLLLPGQGRALVYCAVCNEIIAAVDLDDLHLPLRTEMFKSPDEAHGFPVPFRPGFGHEAMFCPICRGKAIEYPGNVVRTDRGNYVVPDKAPEKEEIKESRDRAEAAHQVHTLEVTGSIPVPATKNEKKETGPACPICGKVCGSLPGLKSHMKSHKGGKKA